MSKKVHVLGQTILQYETPEFILNELNKIYDEKEEKELPPANTQLSGKIKDEFILYHNEMDNPSKSFNRVSAKTIDWFITQFIDYLHLVERPSVQKSKDIRVSSMWVNEMRAGEYNPIHVHASKFSSVGLSSVMMLKFPSNYGKEYSRPDIALNGQLQFVGSAGGQFSCTDYTPNVKIGDFFIFPYDMRHVVYPFNTTKELRRTLSANADVFYNTVFIPHK